MRLRVLLFLAGRLVFRDCWCHINVCPGHRIVVDISSEPMDAPAFDACLEKQERHHDNHQDHHRINH